MSGIIIVVAIVIFVILYFAIGYMINKKRYQPVEKFPELEGLIHTHCRECGKPMFVDLWESRDQYDEASGKWSHFKWTLICQDRAFWGEYIHTINWHSTYSRPSHKSGDKPDK